MKFKKLVELYLKDIEPRIGKNTFITKKSKYENRILPFLGEMCINEITPIIIRKWQNELMTAINPATGENYRASYMKNINSQLIAVFNYAVNFYFLKENPCLKAGGIKKEETKEMDIWTVEEFNKFSEALRKDNRIITYVGFNILFWCGLRTGEMLALKIKDVDLKKKTININKSLQRVDKEDIISVPKTSGSIRKISIPEKLVKILKTYIDMLYEPSPDDRLIKGYRHNFREDMNKYSIKSGVKRIRIHDLRHSHASLLINAGVNPLAISKRLGHAKVDITLNTYSHLYPSSNDKLLEVLNQAD